LSFGSIAIQGAKKFSMINGLSLIEHLPAGADLGYTSMDCVSNEETLEDANKKRDVTDKTILHSDQGFQYTSPEYHEAVKLNGITQSMSKG
jgi:hypothetical protein